MRPTLSSSRKEKGADDRSSGAATSEQVNGSAHSRTAKKEPSRRRMAKKPRQMKRPATAKLARRAATRMQNLQSANLELKQENDRLGDMLQSAATKAAKLMEMIKQG